jgi:hypothetical protein
LRVAFDAPAETAKAIGYTLLTGVKQAGNNLMNAFSTAVSFFQNLFSDAQYWSGIGQRVQAMFMEAINSFNKLLLSAVEGALLKPLSNLPGILGDPFRTALETTNEIRASLESASEANAKNLAEGGASIQKAIDRAASNTAVIEKDWFGVEQSAEDAARHMMDAQEQSRQIREDSEATAANYGEGSAAIRDALNDIRGFDLKEQMGPEQRPDWTQSDEAPPKSAPAPAPSRGAGGSSRSSASAPRPQSSLDRLRQSAQDDPRARAEMFRIQNEQSKAMDRAGTMREGGMFNSAAQLEIKSERDAQQRAEKFRAREIATERFGGNNAGEAFRNFRDMMAEQGVFGSSQKDFEKWAADQAKSETERKEEEAKRSGGAGAGAGSAPQDKSAEIVGKLSELITEVKERLPQNALAA